MHKANGIMRLDVFLASGLFIVNIKNLFHHLLITTLAASVVLLAANAVNAGNTESGSKLKEQEIPEIQNTQEEHRPDAGTATSISGAAGSATTIPEANDNPRYSEEEPEYKASGEQTAMPEKIVVPGPNTQTDSTSLPARESAIEHWELAGYYFRRWDFEMAEAELDLALAYDARLKIAHRDACIVAVLRAQFPRALAEFMMTTGLGEPLGYPDLKKDEIRQQAAILHYNRGLKFARKDMWKNAIAELELALRLAPNNDSVHHALAFAYANDNNYGAAEKHYRATLQLAPSDSAAHADLAYMMLDMGKKEIAEQEMDEAVRRSPRVVAYHVDLGWLAEKKGNLAKAIREFQAAVSLSPEHAGLWTHLGGLLEKHGEAELAADAYRHASQIDPAATEPRIGLERLEHEAS